MNRYPYRTKTSGAIFWLALLPFLLLSFVPQGIMPRWTGGGVEVVLCTDDGIVSVVLGPDGAPVERAHEPCDWSLHQQVVAQVSGGEPTVHFFEWQTAHSPRPSGAPTGDTLHVAYIARAPPLFF